MIFVNRREAGRRLAEKLANYKGRDVVVLALPRGGIALGVEVARRLKAPLSLVLVHKIAHPKDPEYAVGALVEDEKPVYSQNGLIDLDEAWRRKAESRARLFIENQRKLYYDDDIPQPIVEGSTVIIVDDGGATGLTMQAAIMAVRNKHARHIVAAAPVASEESLQLLDKLADEVIVLDDPSGFMGAVGAHYQEFEQISDKEVRELLKEASYELHQVIA